MKNYGDEFKKPMLLFVNDSANAIMTPVIWGIRHMVGFHGTYTPDPPPDDPPDGGTPVASNIHALRPRRKAQVQDNAVANVPMRYRKAA